MLIFHELSPSPNSTKLRMALRYKGIEFEAREIDPQNRQPLIELSGQELAPVIEHDGRTLYDSEAILHYLEANWREAPRLYAADRQGRYDSDQFKGDLESRVGMHWFPTFLHSIGRREQADPQAVALFAEDMAWLDAQLADKDSFGRPIDDLRVAQWATYAFPGPALIERCGLFRVLARNYGLEPGSLPRLEAFLAPWQERLG